MDQNLTDLLSWLRPVNKFEAMYNAISSTISNSVHKPDHFYMTHNFVSIFSFFLVLFTCFLLTTLVITLWSTLNDHKTYIMAVVVVLVVVDLTRSGLIRQNGLLEVISFVKF